MFGLKEARNIGFMNLLESEFKTDLEHIARVTSVPQEDRTDGQEFFLNIMREKYISDKGCPSRKFKKVSRELQEEYSRVHQEICSLLYPAQDL